MTNTEYIEGMFEEPLLLAHLPNGKCPDCDSNRFAVYAKRLIATAKLTGKKAKVYEQDEHSYETSVECQKCGKEIYSD